jgi:NAD(P)-dependent dehydrogenase (short-subunit alcohol dehydrogenase family)
LDLADRVAVVTGGARRVGRAIALALAGEGAKIVIHYNASAAEALEVTAEARAGGATAIAVEADLRDRAAISGLFRAVDEAFGGLDILINSAAILEPVDLLHATEADWERSIGLNLRGAFFCLQEAAVRMKGRGSGVIINLSDVAGRRPWKRYPIHSISKAGVEMLTRVAALALAPEVRVAAVAPGPVLKPERMSDARWSQITRELPLRKSGTPEDVARAVIFLLRNDFITGETLPVDGGDELA